MTCAAPSATPRAHPTRPTASGSSTCASRCARAPENLTDRQRAALAQLQQTNARRYRAYLLKEGPRALYLDDPAQAPAHLDAWLTWATRSRLEPFIRLARTIRR